MASSLSTPLPSPPHSAASPAPSPRAPIQSILPAIRRTSSDDEDSLLQDRDSDHIDSELDEPEPVGDGEDAMEDDDIEQDEQVSASVSSLPPPRTATGGTTTRSGRVSTPSSSTMNTAESSRRATTMRQKVGGGPTRGPKGRSTGSRSGTTLEHLGMGGGQDKDKGGEKILDKDYAGRLTFDPFLERLQQEAIRQSESSGRPAPTEVVTPSTSTSTPGLPPSNDSTLAPTAAEPCTPAPPTPCTEEVGSLIGQVEVRGPPTPTAS